MAINVGKYRETLQKTTTNAGKDNSIFPFWNLKKGQSCKIQLIPWMDPIFNTLYTVKKTVPLKFVDDRDDSKFIYFNAPTIEMYERNAKCSMLSLVRELYAEAKQLENEGRSKDAETVKAIAGQHWMKPTYYHQGFVNSSDFKEEPENVPENPIRAFALKKQLHQIIEQALNGSDYGDSLPTGSYEVSDIQSFLDGKMDDDLLSIFDCAEFRISATAQGEYNSYTTSAFLPRMQRMPEDKLISILEHGFHNLRNRLPERPSDEQFDIMAEMTKVSIDRSFGRDEGRWNPEWEEAGIKPYRQETSNKNSNDDDSDTKTETSKTVSAAGLASALKSRNTETKPAEVAEKTESSGETTSVRDRIAALRNRYEQ